MADAILYTIEGRSRGIGNWVANLKQFVLSEGQTVSSQIVIDEPYWTPFAIDHEQRYMVFVDLPPDVNLNDAVFVYETQYELAQRALVVPYDSLDALADQLTPPEKIIFIMSLPRSGTTLVSKMFSKVDDIWSLSEPDIYTTLGFLSSHGINAVHTNAADADMLNRVTVRLLFRPHISKKDARTLVIKPRSQGLFAIESIHRVFPDARYLFLYREGLDFAESFYGFFLKVGYATTLDASQYPQTWHAMTTHPTTQLLRDMLQHDRETVLLEEFTAAFFAAQCEYYVRTFETGIPYYAIRYNELTQAKEAEVLALLAHCDIPVSALPHMMSAFEQDSQAGTIIAREIEVEPMTDEQKAKFIATLSQHPRFNKVNIRLPDIRHPIMGTWEAKPN